MRARQCSRDAAVADASMDSMPMIAISRSAAEDISYADKKALHLARSGRAGPVLIDVTKDAQQARTGSRWSRPLRLSRHESVGVLDRGAVERATALLVGAKRPLTGAGNGVIQ